MQTNTFANPVLLPVYQSYKVCRALQIARIEITLLGWRDIASSANPAVVGQLHFAPKDGVAYESLAVTDCFMNEHRPREGDYYVTGVSGVVKIVNATEFEREFHPTGQ